MCLTTDEYLHGMISFVNELPRLSMYLVIKGNYNAPERIASNVNQIHSTFKELNLKNDSLRKRFDSIKYDVKRLEEILYDLTLIAQTLFLSRMRLFLSNSIQDYANAYEKVVF